MNRRTKRNLLYLVSATIFALSAFVVVMSFTMSPPVADLRPVKQTKAQQPDDDPANQQLDFSGLLEKRLQGSPPPPPEIEGATEKEITTDPATVAPIIPPDFTLTNLYAGPTTTIASFSKGDGAVESGTIGESVFGAEILEFDIVETRVKVQFRNQPHWLSLK